MTVSKDNALSHRHVTATSIDLDVEAVASARTTLSLTVYGESRLTVEYQKFQRCSKKTLDNTSNIIVLRAYRHTPSRRTKSGIRAHMWSKRGGMYGNDSSVNPYSTYSLGNFLCNICVD